CSDPLSHHSFPTRRSSDLSELRPLSPAQRSAIETFLGESTDLDEVLGRTVQLLSQLTSQVALAQYPSFGSARIRHIELVGLAPHRVMAVLITDTGRVDQRIVESPAGADAEQLARLRERINAELGGVALGDAASAFGGLLERIEPDDRAAAAPLVESLAEQVAANRHDRLVMAGAATLARTGRDFSGSIFPVLEAIEEQVTILRLFGEMDLDADEVSARIGHENAGYGLSETSVL